MSNKIILKPEKQVIINENYCNNNIFAKMPIAILPYKIKEHATKRNN